MKQATHSHDRYAAIGLLAFGVLLAASYTVAHLVLH